MLFRNYLKRNGVFMEVLWLLCYALYKVTELAGKSFLHVLSNGGAK